MPNLSIKDVPEMLANRLRQRAARNHRSLQGELMSIIESAVSEPTPAAYAEAEQPTRANVGMPLQAASKPATDDLMERLQAIVGAQGIDTAQRLSRDDIHDRTTLRRLGS